MHAKTRKAVLLASVILLSSAVARAQQTDAIGQLLQREAALSPNGTDSAPVDESRQTVRQPLSPSDFANFRNAVESARRGDVNGARAALALVNDPAAKKTATWVLVDTNGDSLTFWEADQARRTLIAWPRPARRQAAAEKLIESSGKTPKEIIAWFQGDEPTTARGAIALAAAYRGSGQPDKATQLIGRWWRTKTFDVDSQRLMLARFGDVLTPDDHIARADILLYGTQGPAAREIIAMLPFDQQQAANARLALRNGASNATELAAALPINLLQSSGVAFERAAFLRKRGLTELAAAQLPNFPKTVYTAEQADRVWEERRQILLAELKAGDSKGAYAAAADCGIAFGSDAAEAEFYAGWIALTRLKDPERAARHFAVIDRIGSSPITRARALYWLGRAAEARKDHSSAEGFYSAGAVHVTTFYGQLAAEKIGRRLVLPTEPQPTAGERARFEASDLIQGARLLHDEGQREVFRSFVFSLADVTNRQADAAMLIDLIRNYGDQDASMKVARAVAQKGVILPQRAYPFRTPPQVGGAPEPALVLAITRQESGFDPFVRSGVGARGMMQLMPTTASIVARRMGMDYSPSLLDDPDYNMRLGSSFLGQLVNQFSGSYVMAVAGYNAGPGRPVQWTSYCGDPRGSSTDPIDYIECIPFSETRNYVMRVMEGVQVYRAKLNGGAAPLTLTADLARGSYGYSASVAAAEPTGSTGGS